MKKQTPSRKKKAKKIRKLIIRDNFIKKEEAKKFLSSNTQQENATT